jgi:hypothetical protein
LLRQIDAGAIRPAGDVAAFDGQSVVFRDGSREAFDVVICATGYQTTFHFLDCRLLGADSAAGVPRLFMNLLHPTRDDIAVVGLIQPDSGQWGITDVQARLVAGMAAAARRAPKAAAWLYAQPSGTSPCLRDRRRLHAGCCRSSVRRPARTSRQGLRGANSWRGLGKSFRWSVPTAVATSD